MITLTRKQRESLRHIFFWHEIKGTYREFRSRVQVEICSDAVMIQTDSGMWIGIETDGHRHT